MTFKQFATGVFYLPARAVSGISALMLGATYLDKDGEEQNFRGIFGLAVDAVRFVGNFILDATKFVARGITNFITNHQKAISVAFWSSLALAGAAALTVAFWPAALAAVTGFSVGGVSIASLVGTGYFAQVGAVAGVAAAATSAAVYVGATIINTITAIGSFFAGRKKGNSPEFGKQAPDSAKDLDEQPRRNPLFDLNAQPDLTADLGAAKRSGTSSDSTSEDQPPVHTGPLFTAESTSVVNPIVTPVQDEPTSTVSFK